MELFVILVIYELKTVMDLPFTSGIFRTTRSGFENKDLVLPMSDVRFRSVLKP